MKLKQKFDNKSSVGFAEGDVNFSPQRKEWAKTHIGTKTQKLVDEDAEFFLHQSLSSPCLNVINKSEGVYLEDIQGRKIMDFHGNSVHQVGHGNPRVVNAIKDQLDQLPFCPRRYTNQTAIDLARKLAELAPGNLNKMLFAPGGTNAIGMALKLARYATGRHKTISMWDSFHGASLDAISIGVPLSSIVNMPVVSKTTFRHFSRCNKIRRILWLLFHLKV